MTRLPCQYAIARFLPYAETGEFANVGIVLACPTTGFLAARLMPAKRTARITGFFEQLDARIYRDALRYLTEELERVRKMAQQGVQRERAEFIQRIFVEVTRPREALFRFSDVRVVLADDPETTLDNLFARFVERDFADRLYHDKLIVRGVREVLAKANLREYFKPEEIGNDYVHVHVPFVHVRNGVPACAIKPLDLAKEDPNQVFEHGGHWVDRIRRLRKHNLLPNKMLFAIAKPHAGDIKARNAAAEIVNELRDQGAQVATVTDASAITQFAGTVLH